MNATIDTHFIPRFNPLFDVYFVSEASCIFFADEYPHPFQYITDPAIYNILSFVNNKRSLLEIAKKSGNHSIDQIIHLFSNLHEQQLVISA
ncbi:MAG: hypothetical protein KTR29_02950 [Rhodothermaceae bacterium]|nr:hypothetical protein [Rhodothermaceae bacterium]